MKCLWRDCSYHWYCCDVGDITVAMSVYCSDVTVAMCCYCCNVTGATAAMSWNVCDVSDVNVAMSDVMSAKNW